MYEQEALGLYMKKLRKQRKMTQKQAAEIMEMTRSMYALLETGHVKMNLNHIYIFCQAMKISVSEFFLGYEEVSGYELPRDWQIERTIMNSLYSLNESQKADVLDYINEILGIEY